MQHAGAVIFGGPMSANDADDYVRREIDWIEVPLREQRPFLGICLGAQMLAKHLGARVAPHPQGADPDRLLSDPPDRRPGTRFARTGRRRSITGIAKDSSCRVGAELLAEGDDFPVQAFQRGQCVRLPVSSRRDLRDDALLDHARLRRMDLPGAQPRHQHFEGRAMHDVVERAWLKHFIDGWLARSRAAVDAAEAAAE